MKNKSLILASLAAAAILSAGCEKEKNYEEIRVPGEPIRFTAETLFENGDGTRTEYTGVLSGTSELYERIDWVKNDPMKIIYVQGSAESFANYKVDSFSSSEEPNSYADVVLDGTDELVWGAGSGTNKFYAMYPTTAKNSYASLQKTGSNYRATGTLLPTQDVDATKTQTISKNGNSWTRYKPNMDYNYLLAYADDDTGISNGTVRLPFRPAVTAFEFRFQRQYGDSDRKVTKFELSSSSDALTGQFKIDITGGNAKGAMWNTLTVANGDVPARTTANSVITVNFPTGGVSLPEEGYLDFTVFALPSDLHNLTMRLTYADGKHASLALNNKETGQPYVFTGARKYIITNSNVPGVQGWHYVIDEIPDQTFIGHNSINSIGYNVKSYKWNDREGQGVKYAVAWKTQYFNGTTWVDVPSTGIIPDSDYSINSAAITGTGVATAGYSAGEARSAKLYPDSEATPSSDDPSHSAEAIIAELAGRTEKTGPWDLSMHDVFGNENEHGQTTANSYIVTAPGTYKFPIVYGNAITNGKNYKEAYWPCESAQLASLYNNHASETTFRYLRRFRNATNGYIAAPNILDDYAAWNEATHGQFVVGTPTAAIVWQNSMKKTPSEEVKAIVLEDDVNYDDGYITFTIRPENIRPGNVVIALRASVGDWLPNNNSILWSWQIWVTANDVTPVTVPGGQLMPYNLGYIDSTPAGSMTYPNRAIQFRIVQVEDGTVHEHEDFNVEQRGDGHAWDANVGYNVYYQWGRKDPMLPAKDHDAVTRTETFPAPTGTITRLVYPDADFIRGTQYPDVTAQGKDINGNYPYYYGLGQADYGTGITHPYFAYLNTFSTGWVGGSFNGSFDGMTIPEEWQTEAIRAESSIPVNLWNNAQYTTMDGNTGLGMYKTIYDPCPPGFCVPTVGALSSFTLSNVAGATTEGVYFNASNGGTIFMPYSGARVFYNNGDGTAELWAEEVRRSGLYWTDSAYGSIGNTVNGRYYYSIHFSFGTGTGSLAVNAVTPISDAQHYTKGSSLAIRPMVDPKYNP